MPRLIEDEKTWLVHEARAREFKAIDVAAYYYIRNEGFRAGIERAAQVAESYEPRCDTCPSGVSNAIRALLK